MNDEKLCIEEKSDRQKCKNLIRSQYRDIMVKVDDDIYYLHRLQLALKSGYFEKLFIDDFSERTSDLIELPMIDSDTFSAAVDIMLGYNLQYVANSDNFIPLLMAMDYLQMDIDSDTYEEIARKELFRTETLNDDIFKLYNFIAQFSSYEYLLPIVCKHLSDHIEKLQDREEFLSIPFRHFTRIVSKNKFAFDEMNGIFHAFKTLSRICAKWISHDLQNRLHLTIDLVNAARSRFYLPNEVARKELDLQLSATDQTINVDLISTKFYQLLTCCGEICCSNNVLEKHENETKEDECLTDDSVSSSEGISRRLIMESPKFNFDSLNVKDGKFKMLKKQFWAISFQYSQEPKLEAFLKNGNFYDITVKAGDKLYKLHRCVLDSGSWYFGEIFSNEYSKLAEKCETLPAPPSKDKVYFIDEVDSEIFDIIVNHIYLGKAQFTGDVIVRLFKAIHILKIESLQELCNEWMLTNSESICAADVFEIINFTHANDNFKHLNRFFLSKCIANSWPKIENLPQFSDFFDAITLPEEMHSTTDESNNFYSFDRVDQKTFKLIAEFIYLNEIEFQSNNAVRILKAAELFKIEKLMSKSAEWLVNEWKMIKAKDVIEILQFALNNVRYEVLLGVYLARYMAKWPKVDKSLFCPISFDCLQILLMSHNLCCNNPSDILDICSIWVLHDLENRYRLIPQIACAISRNFSINCDNYAIENPSDLSECSQDFIKDKFWAVLSSTSVLPPVTLSDTAKKRRTEEPTFVMMKDKLFHILSSDWTELESLRVCKDMCDPTYDNLKKFTFPMTATIVDDNLFILYCWRGRSFFHVYNLSSKKLFSLSSDLRFYKKDELKHTLLNCRNQIYCCIENGEVFSYVVKLNRWQRVTRADPDAVGKLFFASDGNTLYRMHRFQTHQTRFLTYYVTNMYDFQKKSWVLAPHITRLTREYSITLELSHDEHMVPLELVYMRNYGFALLFRTKLFLYSIEERIWRDVDGLPYRLYSSTFQQHSTLGQNERDELLCVMNNKLFSLNHSWELRKKMRFRKIKRKSDPNLVKFKYRKFLPFENMIAIHRPTILC